jgi:hypothetical protein
METIVIKTHEELERYKRHEEKSIIFDGNVEVKCMIELTDWSIKASGSIRGDRPIKVGGAIEAGGAISVGGYLNAGGCIDSGAFINAHTSITSGKHINAKGSTSADDSVRAYGSIRVGGYLNAGGYVYADKDINVDWSIGAGSSLHAGGAIISGEHIKAGEYIVAGEALSAHENIHANKVIACDGTITAGGHIISMIFDIKAKAIATRALPFWREFWARMKPLKPFAEAILDTKNCWGDLRELLTEEQAKSVCAWDGWHPHLRAQLLMFFQLKTMVSGAEFNGLEAKEERGDA